MNTMHACYVHVCNYEESPSLAVMLQDFHLICGLGNICHMYEGNLC